MKNLFRSLIAILLISSLQVKADEGMWMPLLLKKYNYEKMKAMGLKLTPEQLYDVNNSSLKDAIVWFNGGCTGEIISNQGLVLTNHHCGYDAIASLSTPQDNILDNGFWAKNRQMRGLGTHEIYDQSTQTFKEKHFGTWVPKDKNSESILEEVRECEYYDQKSKLMSDKKSELDADQEVRDIFNSSKDYVYKLNKKAKPEIFHYKQLPIQKRDK